CLSSLLSYLPLLFFLLLRRPPISTLFPYTTLFRSTISRTRSWYSSGDALSLRTSATTCRRWVPARSLSIPTAAEYRTPSTRSTRSEELTSELQSRSDLVCRLLLEKKKTKTERQTDK